MRNCLPLIAAFILAGCCGSAHRSAGEAPQAVSEPGARQGENTLTGLSVRECMKNASGHAGGKALNILVLSGGGQNGAYGAGILNGWKNHGRPSFDVITGISTGSLISTFAYLGTDADYEKLKELYTTIKQSDIYKPRKWRIINSQSINDIKPFKRLLGRVFTRDLINRVAEASTKKRYLFVATVEMHSGRLVYWDLGKVARQAKASGEEGDYRKYRSILLAATAIPVIFPPVSMGSEIHVDAGAREQMFLRQFMLACHHSHAEKDTVYVIVNNKLATMRDEIPKCFIPIAIRSLSLMMDESRIGGVERVYHLTTGNNWLFQLTYIPKEFELKSSSHAFNTADMNRLFELGVESWRGDPPWQTEPPAIDGDAPAPSAAQSP